MARNTRSSQRHKGNDENSMGGGGISLAKGKWDKNLFVIPFRQGDRACGSTHFLLCDYWAAEWA